MNFWNSQQLEDFSFISAKNIFQVGGCVRDRFLSRPVNDFDFATPLPPAELLKRLPGSRLVSAAQAYPVVVYRGYEIASFRSDKDRDDLSAMQLGVTIEEDSARRDFTINALYVNGLEKVLDPTGLGLKDIKEKVLRFVGDPYERLREDPVRILRAVRFQNAFGFNFHPETLAALQHFGNKLALY